MHLVDHFLICCYKYSPVKFYSNIIMDVIEERGNSLRNVLIFFIVMAKFILTSLINNSYWLTILNRDVYAVLYTHQIKWKVHVYGSVFPHIELFMRLDYWIQHKALSFKSTGICSMKFNKVKWHSCVLQWETM